MSKAPVDRCLEIIINRYGLPEVLAALAREADDRGFNPALFRKLNRVYEWLTNKRDTP